MSEKPIYILEIWQVATGKIIQVELDNLDDSDITCITEFARILANKSLFGKVVISLDKRTKILSGYGLYK